MDITTFTSHQRTLTTTAGDISYTEIGSGPVAVFVHGMGTNAVLWRHVIAGLSDMRRCIAVDLPGHGGTPPRTDVSVESLATMVADLCDGLGLGQIDLVGNDTGGAVAQVLAAGQPSRLRSLALTNCDTEGNFPPQVFVPVVESAGRGELAPLLLALAGDLNAVRQSPFGIGFEHPDQIPDDEWRAYLEPIAGTPERAKNFESMFDLVAKGDLKAATESLRTLNVPTVIVWGTDDEAFSMEWAQKLRDVIPGARLTEVEGARLFFPSERPTELIAALRSLWQGN